MNPKDRLEILDGQLFELFAENHGPTLDVDLLNWIQLITVSGPSEQNFYRLNSLAFFIFVERSGRSFGEPERFKVSSDAQRFQKFVYKVNVFSSMSIPYSEWDSLVVVLFEALTKMVRENKLDFNSVDCEEVNRHLAEIFERLKTKPGFDQTYTDFLNGAL